MSKQTELKLDKATAQKLYNDSPAFFQETLEQTFGKETFHKNIMDRVKTWEDAFGILELDIVRDLPFPYPKNERQRATNAWFKRDVVREVLNEGWVPDWSNSDEYKYYPYFYINSGGGFAFYGCSYGYTFTLVGGRLVFRSSELATYAGKQFLELYKSTHI